MVHSGISLIFWLRYLVAFLDLLWLQDYFIFLGFVFIFDTLAISYFTFKIHL